MVYLLAYKRRCVFALRIQPGDEFFFSRSASWPEFYRHPRSRESSSLVTDSSKEIESDRLVLRRWLSLLARLLGVDLAPVFLVLNDTQISAS